MLSANDITGVRKDYKLQSLSEYDADIDPFIQFHKWWNDSVTSQIDEYNAMILASCNQNGKPSARVVLLKAFDETGFTFFTNYESKKGKEILGNPNVALVFFWKELERQVRIEGKAEKTSEIVSDKYFTSRPLNSQLGAWSSPQSIVIKDRDFLVKNFKYFTEKYNEQQIPKPPNWGGFLIKPNLFEFWQGRPSRLHDRIEYTLTNENSWTRQRLAP